MVRFIRRRVSYAVVFSSTTVCSSSLRVPHRELEERILGAVRERTLVPENVLYVVEKTLAIIRDRTAETRDLAHDRRRLAEVEVALERAVDLAVETSGIAAARQKIEALETERAGLEERLARGFPEPPSVLPRASSVTAGAEA